MICSLFAVPMSAFSNMKSMLIASASPVAKDVRRLELDNCQVIPLDINKKSKIEME